MLLFSLSVTKHYNLFVFSWLIITVLKGRNGGILQLNRISWHYLCYSLDVYSGPLYTKIPEPVKQFFTTLYVVGGGRLLNVFRGKYKIDDQQV